MLNDLEIQYSIYGSVGEHNPSKMFHEVQQVLAEPFVLWPVRRPNELRSPELLRNQGQTGFHRGDSSASGRSLTTYMVTPTDTAFYCS